MATYGYIRVSSYDQNEDRQLIAMRNARVPIKNIYFDKQSGSDFDRPMYKKMLEKLKSNDIVYIKSIDRLGTFLSDIVLQVLSFVAENERTSIRRRQKEGIEAAKLRGVKFGRPKKKMPDDFPIIYEKWKRKEITASVAATMCGVSKSTYYRHAQQYKP